MVPTMIQTFGMTHTASNQVQNHTSQTSLICIFTHIMQCSLTVTVNLIYFRTLFGRWWRVPSCPDSFWRGGTTVSGRGSSQNGNVSLHGLSAARLSVPACQ